MNVRSLVALVVIAVAVRGSGAEEVTSARFPDADAVAIDDVSRVVYSPDGTYVRTDESWMKILTEKGRREESVISLSYSKRYGRAVVEYVGIVSSDGKERAVDVSTTTSESTDNGSMGANIYDPLDRRIVCTVPELKVGDTLHVRTRTVVEKARCVGKWSDIAIMEWTHPIVRATYEVTAPKELPLRKIAVRNPLGNVTASRRVAADGSVVHLFTATNSAQVFPEPDMPPLFTQVQNVRVSTAADWPEISKWYWELCSSHLMATNGAMDLKVRELARACGKDDQALIRAIFRFVSQEVRYMGLTMEDTSPGYAPHDVNLTFDRRYGVCRDKAGLLVAMLRLAGVAAYPVLIHVGAKLDPEVPQPFFNHAIVAVENVSGSQHYILMDPTNENAKDLFPAYLSNCSYLVARPEGDNLRLAPVTPSARNRLAVQAHGTLAKDGSLFLEGDVAFDGINDTAYRNALARMKREDRVKFFERQLKAVAAGAELVRCAVEPDDMRDTEKPVRAHLAWRVPEALLRGETRAALNVPFLTRRLGIANFLLADNTSLAQRRYPLAIDSTAAADERIEIDLNGAVGAGVDIPVVITNETAGLKFAHGMFHEDGTLVATRQMSISDVEFSPAAYGDLRETLKGVEAVERRMPAFAEDALADADVLYRLDESATTVLSDRAWVATNVTVREILTYDGKKKSAELKFSLHPLWKNVTLLEAVVSNRSGKVSRVAPEEVNFMDVGWAADSPRYPAGRIMIVSLPGVEIGSVVSVKTCVTVTNAPASFYATYLFDAHEPVDRRVVSVNGWRREVVRPRRLPNEPAQPDAALWRDAVVISSNDFSAVRGPLAEALDVEPVCEETRRALGLNGSIEKIRNWMARYVHLAGPGFWDVPLDAQLTDSERVLAERYATRLDYVRTLCALLRGAGYDADVVLAANDSDWPDVLRHRIRFECPNVRAFSLALCRVRVREGGLFGFGGTEKTYFLGTENEYVPLGATNLEGADFFDAATGEFGRVTVPSATLLAKTHEETIVALREDGSADIEVENLVFGPSAGAFRKRYREMLPEERFRRYQEILGDVAQAATATSELETDVESYPAKRRFSCHVPNYATMSGDAMTLVLPPFVSSVPNIPGTIRRSPFAVGASPIESETVRIVFPEGYDALEHMPDDFAFADPCDSEKPWMTSVAKATRHDGRIEIVLRRTVCRRSSTWLDRRFIELVRDWNRIASARSNRTFVARRSR